VSGSLAALLLLLAADGADYPLGPLPARSLVEPSGPFVLTDLRYRFRQAPSVVQAFGARARLRHFGFVGAFVDDQRRGASIETRRFTLSLSDDGSFTTVQGGFRGAKLTLDAELERRPPQDGRGVTVDAEAGLRLTPDLEAFVSAFHDGDPRPRRAATLDEQRLGLLWQRGTRLDVSASVSRRTERTPAGFDVERLRGSVFVAGYAWRGEADAEMGWERTRGRTRAEEVFANLALRRVLGARILIEARSRNRWEPGVTWFEHDVGFGLSLHGRGVRLPRAGLAAERALDLARLASALGYNERRVYDEAGRRAFRERLALLPQRGALAPVLRALHEAEIAERNVPLLGVSLAEHVQSQLSARRRSLDAFLGVPWPVRWPWQRHESAAPFLLLRYSLTRATFGGGFSSNTHTAALEAALNREMSLVLRRHWPGVTPFEVALIQGRARSFEVEFVYAFGR
jgi:hypothetical protein